jgi:hypothetical protein
MDFVWLSKLNILLGLGPLIIIIALELYSKRWCYELIRRIVCASAIILLVVGGTLPKRKHNGKAASVGVVLCIAYVCAAHWLENNAPNKANSSNAPP